MSVQTVQVPKQSVGAAIVRRIPLPLLLLLPGLIVFFLFFLCPLGILVINSFFGYSRLTGIVEEPTLANYVRILTDGYYLSMLARTIGLALKVAAVTVLVGYPVALYFYVAPERQKGIILLFVLSPLLISVIIRTFGWLVILGPNGLLDSIAQAIGLQSGNILHTEIAVIIGLVNVFLPFFVLSVATSLNTIDPSVPLAAASLGASPGRVFLNVILPLTLPGIISGLLIVISLSSSSLVTPALLGGSNFKVLSTQIYQNALVLQNWPFAGALAIVLIVLVLAILGLQNLLIQRSRFKVVFR